jgi:tetratricopeptide (TPR) repeat protein
MNFILIFLLILLASCSTGSTIKVESNPEQVEVVVVTKESSKIIGKTPLLINEKELGIRGAYQVQLQKEGFKSQTILVPESNLPTESQIFGKLEKVASIEDSKSKDLNNEELNKLTSGIANSLLLIRQKNLTQAETILVTLSTQYPGIASIHELLGNIYYIQKDSTKARQAYSKAKDLNPNNPKVDQMLRKLQDLQGVR